MRRDTFRRSWAPPPVKMDWDCIGHSSMHTFTFQRSSKALSVHVEGFNISVSSAVLRGVRPKPKHHARMERAAAAPRIKRRHSSPRVDRQRSTPSRLPSLSAIRARRHILPGPSWITARSNAFSPAGRKASLSIWKICPLSRLKIIVVHIENHPRRWIHEYGIFVCAISLVDDSPPPPRSPSN